MTAFARSTTSLSVADIASRLRLSRQATHRLAVSLELAGWVRLASNTADCRTLQLSLTPLGRRTLPHADATLTRLLLEVTNDISVQTLRLTTATLQRLSECLRACQQALRPSTAH